MRTPRRKSAACSSRAGRAFLLEEDEVRSRRDAGCSPDPGVRPIPVRARLPPAGPLLHQLRMPTSSPATRQVGALQVVGQLHLRSSRAQGRRGEERAAAEGSGRERLGEGAEEDEARVLGEERGEVCPQKSRYASSMPTRPSHEPTSRSASAGRQGGAGRVVGRAEENELRSLRGPRDLVEAKRNDPSDCRSRTSTTVAPSAFACRA